jgi:hypothetical protein
VTSGPSVTAGWALWGKEPGTRDDYSVLSFSDGPLSKGEFAQLLAYFAPGSPSAEPDTPGSLPWVTLSRVGVGQELYLGVSVQTGTSDKDGVGRPISRTVYFCVPYAPLAGSPVSYQDLYAAVAGPGVLASAGRNVIPLAIPPLDPAALAGLVRDGFGPEMVTRTTAMLLAGPVTVTGPKFPLLEDRLRFFDAVAALLPYGYRAYMTAASWSDSGAGERFRLVFANRARDEAFRVSWGTPPRPPTSGPAAEYLGYLDRALRGADAGRLESVIEYLAQASHPCKFDEPGRAVERLADFFRPAVVAEGVDSGGVPLSDIRRLFTDGRVRELAASRRTQLLQQLIRGGVQQDMDLITRWYSEIAGDDPGVLFTDVAKVCRTSLWSSGSGGLARQYLNLMMRLGRTDDLLALLVPAPGASNDPVPGLDALGPLLAEFVIAAPAGTGAFPRTQDALEGSPAAGAALLAYLASSWQPGSLRLGRAAEWLERVMDEVVRPFVVLLGDAFGATPEAIDTAVISRLDGHGNHASVRYLLRAAYYRKRLYLVLPALAGWLAAGRGDAAGPDTRYWGDAVRELTPATTDETAWLDLVLLVTGNEPRGLLSGRQSQPQFSRQLARAWQELAVAAGTRGAAVDELVESALTAFLQRAPWRADRTQAAAVRTLVQALTAQGARPRLLEVALDPLETLRQMPPGASPGEIAQACVRAHAGRIGIPQIMEALAQSGAVTSARQAVWLVERVHTELATAGARDESFTWPLDLAAALAAEGIGRAPTADFASRAVIRSSEEMLYRIRLLDTLARSAPPDAPPPIDARLLEYLESSRQELDDIVKDARKRQPRSGFTGKLLHRGSEGKPAGPAAGAETATGHSGGQS